jgi:hypothetical protein
LMQYALDACGIGVAHELLEVDADGAHWGSLFQIGHGESAHSRCPKS